ncbi:MAG: dockerin type I repeat-containing protein [Planctomycetota bacterium]|nr:dockerin type I repeat-containing protein [Planctomycetota bacterium]
MRSRAILVLRLAVLLAGGATGVNPVLAQGLLEVPEGYRSRLLFEFDPTVDFTLHLQALCYSPTGEPILYEHGELRVTRGDSEVVLARFEPPVFGSFCKVMPSGGAVIFGENSTGDIFSVPLEGGGARKLGNLPFIFDLAFAPEAAGPEVGGQAFVSALGPVGNSIYRFDAASTPPIEPPDEVVTGIPDFSGPLTFDEEGNLYYVTASFESESLVRFSPPLLARGLGPGAIEFAEGEVLLSELDGAFNMEWLSGKLYLTDLGFGSGVGRLVVIDSRRNFLVSTFASVPFDGLASVTSLAVHPGSEDFEPGAGEAGGKLLVHTSDFATLSHVVEVTPEFFFVRGEVNGDEPVDLSDAVHLLGYLFLGGAPPSSRAAADVNADGRVDVTDPIYLLDFLFRGGPTVPAPFPERGPDLR